MAMEQQTRLRKAMELREKSKTAKDVVFLLEKLNPDEATNVGNFTNCGSGEKAVAEK